MTPVVDREALARALHGSDTLDPEGCAACRHSLYEADRLIASGVVQDSADERRKVADEIAAAIEANRAHGWARDYYMRDAVRIAREVGAKP